MLKYLSLLLTVLLIINGCKEKSTPTIDALVTPSETKSQKRGIAFDLTSSADFAAISKGVSWWYNWRPICNSKVPPSYYLTYGMDFIPMLWGGNTSTNDMNLVKSYILAHPEIQFLLVMNEPNLTDQANRTPGQAASDWIKYEQVVGDLAAKGRTIYLVGPAMSWGTMANYPNPVVWLDAFSLAYKSANGGREPKLDFLAFHWYDYGLNAQLDALKKYNKMIWVTEMANWNSQINSYAKQALQMQEMVAVCESMTDVYRYAWFYGRGSFPDNKFTYLLTPNDGELSDLGKLYINLPYK